MATGSETKGALGRWLESWTPRFATNEAVKSVYTASSSMRTRTTKYLSICAVVALLGTVFYFSEYSMLTFGGHTVRRDYHKFVVEHFDLLGNDTLQFHGRLFGKNSDSSVQDAIRMHGLSALVNDIKPKLLEDPQLRRVEFPDAQFFQSGRIERRTNCRRLFGADGNKKELSLAANVSTEMGVELSPSEYIEMTKDCSNFRTNRGYIMSPLTKVEEDFPIAFSILTFKDTEQTERLLRAIYRPQNVYCIHVDNKSDEHVSAAMEGVAGCFDNVFMSSRSFDVRWGEFSVLAPDLTCMEDLWTRTKTKWKYFINLTGQEFPLRTNYELVKVLTAYQGANDLEGTILRANKNRWRKAGTPPHDIVAVKGSVHIVVNRDYVDYVLHNEIAKDLLNWTKYTEVPDETFFATLNHNPALGIRGSYTGFVETESEAKPFLARYKNWGDSTFGGKCYGKRARGICVFGVGDLPELAARKELFANKFHYDFQRFTYTCMEELLFNRTREEYLGQRSFDTRYYEKVGFVQNQINWVETH